MLHFSDDFSQTVVMGRLGKDPEYKATANGVSVANFSIASNRKVKRGEKWEDSTNWTSVVTWNKFAENVAHESYGLKKGDHVLVVGRTQTRQYEDKDGNTRYSTELHADEVYKLMNVKKAQGSDSASFEDETDPEDIPF